MAYEKTYDLLELAIWMQSDREGVTLNDIATKFKVSRRTAERMRDMIVAKFPQVVEEIGENNIKRWHIPQGTLKDFIQFDADEITVLESAKKLFEKQQLGKQAEILGNVINKMKANIKPDVLRKILPDAEVLTESEMFVYRHGPKLNINPNIIKTIQQALLECHRINIFYMHNNSQKIRHSILDPYGFLYGERNHYLVAHHSDGYFGNDVHLFSLTNIKKVEITDEILTVVPNFNLKNYVEQSFGVFQEPPFDVEWLFAKEVADEAEKYIFHPSQKLQRNKDGSLTVTFRAGGRKEMDWHLYTWGNHVKVIKPADWYG
ncbi:MAG: WYL domain-containing protein [Alphaproteobacteria bacterium]|nr:WYL domain-containing protein [Alphaproteobacteria bacterium]